MGRLRAQYGAVAQLEHPLMEVCMTRAVMTYKINHIVRQHPRGRLTELVRRHDALQSEALLGTLCLPQTTPWSPAARAIRRLPVREGGLGIPAMSDIADAASQASCWRAGPSVAFRHNLQ
jgi:hypothetical protein